METILYAPSWYWEIPYDERAKGRCGPGHGLGDKLVPEKNWGLSMTGACQIHDKMYERGKTELDREEADRVFLNNMLRLVEANSNFIMKPLRRQRALTYYAAVRDFGGPSFWNTKNRPEEWGSLGV